MQVSFMVMFFLLSFLRTDISDPLEGTDWSLEGLQLLLRSQQYGLEPTSLLDVSVGPCPGAAVGNGGEVPRYLWVVNQIAHAVGHVVCHVLPAESQLWFDLLVETGRISDFKRCFFTFLLKIYISELLGAQNGAFGKDVIMRPNTST